MRISRADVEHIAGLARIELTAAERAAFETELSAILDFVAKLEEVATANVEPLSGGHDLVNVMREDAGVVPRGTEAGTLLVASAPRKKNGYVEVPAVFDREA